jgi:transcriptional regulator with XRE-family HTH domain
MDELWRRALGRQLRELRISRGERLDDTAARAGISPQYLSEVERGRKDPSSEMIGAVIGALESTLAEVLVLVARDVDARTDAAALARSADVIDIRSTTVLRALRSPHSPAAGRQSDAKLCVAA